jgi:hypothetical protein
VFCSPCIISLTILFQDALPYTKILYKTGCMTDDYERKTFKKKRWGPREGDGE